MLKWTLSSRGADRAGDAAAGRYQIKRASVRVLRTENDKENSDHVFSRWIHRDRRAGEPPAAKKEAARRAKVRCNPFDPRRMFAARDEPESDSGSVYMRLERLPAAEFTNKPSGRDLRRPVALKGDSPEAQLLTDDKQRERARLGAACVGVAKSSPQAERLYGSTRAPDQRKLVKKACVGPGAPGHAHTTTGQHIHHDYGRRAVSGALQLRLPGASRASLTSGHGLGPRRLESALIGGIRPAVNSDGQHNTSSERGDSGISEGLVSPLSESQDSHECWEEGSAAGEASRPPAFYFSRPGHLRTDPALLEPTERRSARRRGDRGQAELTQVSAADVLSALGHCRDAADAAGGAAGSLRRSRSFSDVSTLSRDEGAAATPAGQTSSWGDPFAENSGGTVIERSAGRPQKSVRFALDEDDPIYHEINGSYAGNNSEALRRSQLYRSYQNIGSVFVGMEGQAVPAPACRPLVSGQQTKTATDAEETYLVMRSPIKWPSRPNVADARGENMTSGRDSAASAPRRQRETVARLTLLLEDRLPTMESDGESADWSLEAVINDTLPRELPEPDAANGESPGAYGGVADTGEPNGQSSDSGAEEGNVYCRLAAPPVYARLDPAKLSPQVDKVTWHGPGRPTVRSVKSRRQRASPGAAGRIWRHPRPATVHSTPRKRTARHLRDDSNDFQLGSPAGEPVLGPGDTYCNALAFARTADSSLATSVWMGLMGRKSRRVVSTQLRSRDLLQARGQLKLRIYENSGLLTVHMIRARKLRSRTSELCNVYVKVSLVPDSSERSFCRTRLVRHTNAPLFDERFSFDFLPEDHCKRLLVSAWHRHLRRGRSELLGCMSFGVSNIMTTEITGWFRLLAESIGRSRHFAVRTPAGGRARHTADCSDPWQERTWEEPRAGGSVVTYRRPAPKSPPAPELGGDAAPGSGSVTCPTLGRQRVSGPVPGQRPIPSPVLSRRPVPSPVLSRRPVPSPVLGRRPVPSPVLSQRPAQVTSQVAPGSAPGATDSGRPAAPPLQQRRRALVGQEAGRRTAAFLVHPNAASGRIASSGQEAGRALSVPWEAQRVPAGPYHHISIQRRQKGFGLSLAWTCPPSVVFVEPGQSAAFAGLRSGDYVVRMGAENVVLMDQATGLELIQRQGDVLEMEVYRPGDGVPPSMLDVLVDLMRRLGT
ncbi:uncharacterized protein LOC119100588 [Pollicipes pollicipes]|uniref:uncharacterized protein LOC119100588 n=1 Tax=Pollicipes pollicipes TaxID=41117 RepID=UPI001884B9D2|nr:uncharacterized protein LOC119100588 [Pollicipes pollicipes]